MSGLTCGVQGCTGMVMPLSAMPACECCKKPHCIAHRTPESHGCGDAARNKAHMDNAKAADAKRREVKELGTADARAKLAKKREQMDEARKKKPTVKKG
jgi:predicted nucleic acid binding AN1-type Zn finger protein